MDKAKLTVTARPVALYNANFRGLFGRNRTSKFTSSDENVEAPADPAALAAFIANLAEKFKTDIKAKKGILKVVRYDGCEVSTYANGVSTQTIPMFESVTVLSVEI